MWLSNINYIQNVQLSNTREYQLVSVARPQALSCKHIYRLAMEFEMITPKHFDHKVLHGQKTILTETDLKKLKRDETKWGSWDIKVHHANPRQIVRQYRAYAIIKDDHLVRSTYKQDKIGAYKTTLSSCNCPDFIDRKLPCKHIYCRAILENIPIPVPWELAENDNGEW